MPETPPILTVTQLTLAIKHSLESQFPAIFVQGEISNFKLQSSGHLYFSLKDDQAQISAVMFRGNATRLTQMPKGGDQVIIRGELNVYPPNGKYQIVVRELHYVGLGALLLKLEQLKQKLHQKGWFAQELKKPLPRFPKRIGVVTSPSGAAIQDILNVLNRRHAGFHLILNPVRVQGAEAAAEIAAAIRQFNAHQLVDVIIVGRGGGSIEDLWPFNEEIVAEAIHHSQIPIISAVGHETDTCLSDFVADVRAPTPSAAAEIVIAEKTHQVTFLQQTRRRLQQTLFHLVSRARHQLDRFRKDPRFRDPYTLLGPYIQRCDEMRTTLDTAMRQLIRHQQMQLVAAQRQVVILKPTVQLAHFRQRLLQLRKALNLSVQRLLVRRQERFKALTSQLHAIDPKNLLSKGYSILFAEKGGSVVKSAYQLVKQERLRALLVDGEATLTVEDISTHE